MNPSPLTARARTLRRDATEAETVLWRLLRHRRLGGIKIRRQVPLGPYVADFVCLERRLVIEADGGQHGAATDAARDAWLAANGFRVLRLWNHDILGNREGMLAVIARALGVEG